MILLYFVLAILFLILLKAVPLFWNRHKFFAQHLSKSKTTKKICVLPLNFGLGQVVDFLNPCVMFDYYLKIAKLGVQNDGILIVNLGTCPLIMLSNPKYVKEICVSNYQIFNKGWVYGYFRPLLRNGLIISEGAHWKLHRNMVNGLLGPHYVSEFVHVMQDKTGKRIAQWRDNPESAKNVSVTQELTVLAFSIAMDVVFGMDYDPHVYEQIESLWDPILHDFYTYFLSIGVTSETVAKYLPWGRRIDKTIIDKRKKQGFAKTEQNLLSLMMRADSEHGYDLKDEDLLDDSITLLFDIQQKVIQEVDSVTDLTFDAMQNMTYLHQVINETLRLYPPIPEIDKTNTKDAYIGDYFVPKGSLIGVNVVALHRDPSVWHNPTQFDPSRWDKNTKQSEQDLRFSYLPFSIGHRDCIGKLFTLSEVPLVVTMLLKSFTIEFAEGFDASKLVIELTAVAKPINLRVNFIPRNKQ